jgi:hypothetical protein
MNSSYTGFWGLLILAADVYALYNIWLSGSDNTKKVLWTILVVLLPVLGFIVWLVAGPKRAGGAS